MKTKVQHSNIPGSQLLSDIQKFFSCLCSKVTLTFSHSFSLSLTLSHSHTQSISHSLSTWWTTFIFISMLKSHFHTHSHSFSLSHSFTHSRHAEQLWFSSLCSKFIAKIAMWFFYILILIITLSCEFRVHRAGSQLKNRLNQRWHHSKAVWRIDRIEMVNRSYGRKSAFRTFVTCWKTNFQIWKGNAGFACR